MTTNPGKKFPRGLRALRSGAKKSPQVSGPLVVTKGVPSTQKKPESSKPHQSGQPGQPRHNGIYGDPEALAPTPSNLALIERTKAYSKEVAVTLKPGIDNAREFVLRELFPQMLALQNGLLDGFDVIKLLLGESSSFQEIYVPMQHMQALALRMKMASFIGQTSGLSKSELATFMSLVLLDNPGGGKETDKTYKAISDLIQGLATAGDTNKPLGLPGLYGPPTGNPRRAARLVNRMKNLQEAPPAPVEAHASGRGRRK